MMPPKMEAPPLYTLAVMEATYQYMISYNKGLLYGQNLLELLKEVWV